MERKLAFLDILLLSHQVDLCFFTIKGFLSSTVFDQKKKKKKFYRKDGHQWKKKKDGRAIAEAHERLKFF